MWAAVVVLLRLCAGGGILWIQRPQKLGEFVEQESPDNHYTASVGTWHAMRIFGADRFTYRFTVQGLGGSVFEKWEIPVPSGKLATNYPAQSISDLTFDKHGHIEWLADSSSAKFLVRDIEVARYDVPELKVSTGPPMFGPETRRTPLEVDNNDAEILAVGPMLRGMKEQGASVGVTYYDAARDETGNPWVLALGKDRLAAERIGAAGLDMRLGDKPEEFAMVTGLGAAYVERTGRMVPLNGTLLSMLGSAKPNETARGRSDVEKS